MCICVKQYDITCCMHNKSMELYENLSSELILLIITVQAIGKMFLVTWAVLSSLLDNRGDSRFGPYFLVSRSEYEISRIIAEVCHLFSRLVPCVMSSIIPSLSKMWGVDSPEWEYISIPAKILSQMRVVMTGICRNIPPAFKDSWPLSEDFRTLLKIYVDVWKTVWALLKLLKEHLC